jgi:hypothetical protein
MNLLRRRDTEALVAGERVDHDGSLDDVDAFLGAMRSEGLTPAPEPRPTLASTLDGRRPLRPATGPRVHATFPARRPRRRVLRPAAVVGAAGAVLFGGLATAGALPGPVQRATADVSAHVGIHLPGATDSEPDVRIRVDPDPSGRERPTPRAPRVTTTPTAPAQPPVAPSTPVPAPAPPTVPSVPLPVPTPITTPSGLPEVLPSLPPVGPTGPAGPSSPGPVRSLIEDLLP